MDIRTEIQKREAETRRANWSNQLEFILTLVGFAVGLGNVWRFPYLCFKNGGGAFLIPYFTCLLLIGIPCFYLEICLGQFSSLGPVKVWRINPWFKGLGVAMLTVTSLITTYYAVIIAYCIFFFFASINLELPWQNCESSWSTCSCRDGSKNDSVQDPWNGTRKECINVTYTMNSTTSPSDEYFNNYVLDISSGIEHMKALKWDVTLCNLMVWIVTFCVLSKGIKSLGKVSYFTALFPYFLLTALLIRGLTLEGYMDGIRFYLLPDFSRLYDVEVWSDAAVQIFYSLSTCVGGLIAMSSYNEFNNNALRDAFLVPIINGLTSFYAGFVIFSILGFMANRKGTTVDKVATGGPGLAFVVYPEALSQMPLAPVWAVLFFLMMIILGFSSLFSLTEAVITGVYDQIEKFMQKDNKRLYIFRFVVCLCFFLLGLPMTTNGGLYLLNLLDNSVGGFPILIIGILELIVVVYIYGTSYTDNDTNKFPMCIFKGFFHLKSDIEMMIGKSKVVTVSFYFFGITWCFISPALLLLVILLKAMQHECLKLGSYVYPDWANGLGWAAVVFPLIFIPIWMIYVFLVKDISTQCRPRSSWGPSSKPRPEWSVFIHPFKEIISSINHSMVDKKDFQTVGPLQPNLELYPVDLTKEEGIQNDKI